MDKTKRTNELNIDKTNRANELNNIFEEKIDVNTYHPIHYIIISAMCFYISFFDIKKPTQEQTYTFKNNKISIESVSNAEDGFCLLNGFLKEKGRDKKEQEIYLRRDFREKIKKEYKVNVSEDDHNNAWFLTSSIFIYCIMNDKSFISFTNMSDKPSIASWFINPYCKKVDDFVILKHNGSNHYDSLLIKIDFDMKLNEWKKEHNEFIKYSLIERFNFEDMSLNSFHGRYQTFSSITDENYNNIMSQRIENLEDDELLFVFVNELTKKRKGNKPVDLRYLKKFFRKTTGIMF